MNLLITCAGIFTARIMDVSVGTIRTITMVKGNGLKSALLAFVEVLIWFLVAREALNTNYTSMWIAISYSAGYATGTYVGSILSKIFIKGNTTVQVITSKATKNNIKLLRDKGYALTVLDINDDFDGIKKKMLLLEINNSRIKELSQIIRKIDKSAFITYSETKTVINGFLK